MLDTGLMIDLRLQERLSQKTLQEAIKQDEIKTLTIRRRGCNQFKVKMYSLNDDARFF